MLQQYVVDNYVKIETHRLRWIRTNQHNIRSDLYQGLQDCLDGGENNAGTINLCHSNIFTIYIEIYLFPML